MGAFIVFCSDSLNVTNKGVAVVPGWEAILLQRSIHLPQAWTPAAQLWPISGYAQLEKSQGGVAGVWGRQGLLDSGLT